MVSGYNGKEVSVDDTELLVNDLISGTKYYYRMRSVGLLDLQSPYSNYESIVNI